MNNNINNNDYSHIHIDIELEDELGMTNDDMHDYYYYLKGIYSKYREFHKDYYKSMTNSDMNEIG